MFKKKILDKTFKNYHHYINNYNMLMKNIKNKYKMKLKKQKMK